MGVKFERKDWDSDFFGYEVFEAKVGNKETISDHIKKLKSGNTRLIYLKRTQPLPDAELSGAGLMDIKLLYSKKVSGICHGHIPEISSFLNEKDANELIQLSLASGVFSRFKIDKNFTNGEFEKLYTEWIIKSVERKIADEVLVYRDGEAIVGMVTIAIKNNIAEIGLIAVKEGYRGKNIGGKLLNAVNEVALKNNCSQINVSTQQFNEMACRFLRKKRFHDHKKRVDLPYLAIK